ncbi:SpoIIE family protein phosphatase [Caldicellulosiruptoraceae bacterium PP1]
MSKKTFPKEYFESVLDGMLDLVRVISLDGTIIFNNNRMKEEFGETVGKKCYEVLCKTQRCDECISVKSINEQKRFMKYERYEDKIYYVISSPVYNNESKIIGTVEVFRDVTEQRKMEERLKRQNDILKRDVEFAKRLQQQLLPIIPKTEGYRITYTYKPCDRLGGDFLDVINLDNKLLFYVADVAGHGLLASMVTIFVKQSLIKNAHESKDKDIETIIKGVLQDFIEMNFPSEVYITFVLGMLDKESGKIKLLSAGHVTEPIVVHSQRKIKVINLSGQPVASIDLGQNFEVKEVTLNEKDKLILYSDGLIESKNKQGEMYGKKRLIKRLISIKNINAELLVRDIRNFAHEIDDDITILIIEKI